MDGNDVLSRLLYGGRQSLLVAFGVNLLGLLIGGTLGAVAAYFRGFVDTAIMRTIDIIIAFPPLILAIAISQAFTPSTGTLVLALLCYSIPAFARVSRASTLRLCALPFMTAARLSATSHNGILRKHIAPNVLPQLASYALLGVGVVVVLEGAMSFLGLGTPPPNPSWGGMIFHGQSAMLTRPHLLIVPSVMLSVTVLCFNLIGEALRERLDAK